MSEQEEVREDLEGSSKSTQPTQPAQQEQQYAEEPMTRPRLPDKQWPNRDPLIIPVSQERLNVPHQTVTITNDSHIEGWPGPKDRPRPQTHIVIDRFQRGVEIRPGETKHDVDLLVSDIKFFAKQREHRPDHLGRPKPRHPLRIHDVKIEGESSPRRPTRIDAGKSSS